MSTQSYQAEYEKFKRFNYNIDQEIPFGLRIHVDHESTNYEEGTICLLPKTQGAPLHKHSTQEEEFTVLDGEMILQVGKRKLTLKPGETVRFPKNTPHTYANERDKVCIFKYKLTPGGDFTKMMREFEKLGKSGKVSRIGEAKTMIHIAALISKFDHHVRSVSPPHFVLKALGSLSRFL